jgi:ribonucleoside-diphosphate reductase alpha chain
MVRYIDAHKKDFNWELFIKDIPVVVRAMDNVTDRTVYPLEVQKDNAMKRRRMGLGVTGMANALEFLGHPYASEGYLKMQDSIMDTLKNVAYQASAYLANEKGSFPLFDKAKFLDAHFIKSLSPVTRNMIETYGIRNSHLISFAPTGTISLTADNVSSGIEPVFSHSYTRTIQTFEGPVTEEVKDYAYAKWGLKGKTSSECTVMDHVNVLANAQKHCDSAVSKTCNVGDRVTFDEFKDVYMRAYELGCKGITTFRASGKRYGVLNELPAEKPEEAPKVEEKKDVDSGAEACYYNPITGAKECG